MVKTKTRWLSRGSGYGLFFAFLWWSFSDASSYQLWLGAIIVAAATAVAVLMPASNSPSLTFRMNTVARFISYFVYQSLKGGLSVAWLALLPQSSVHPRYIEYTVQLPRDAVLARMLFASCLCIFPGSLSCGYRQNILVIHVLDEKLIDLKAIRDLERMTAAIFS